MTTEFDTIIIGAGPGGLAAAYALAPHQHVLVIENDLWGGTCPNRGCDPKKMLYSAVEAQDHAGHLQQFGLKGVPTIDWPALMAFKRGYTDKVPAGTLSGLQAANIATIHGEPHFVATDQVVVAGVTYQATNFIIATGQAPVIPEISGRDYLQTSTDFLALPQLPKRIALIGAGYVALELANIAASAGAEVHILQHNQRILRSFPENYTQLLSAALTAKGITFHWDTELTSVTEQATGFSLATNTTLQLNVDAVFAASGRRPQLASLNLEQAGVTIVAKGISVNDHLQTTNPRIYAVGDVIAKTQPKLTPVSSFEGRYAARTILDIGVAAIAYPPMPQVVYASPQLAQVGVKLGDAKQQPEQYRVVEQDTTQWYTFNRLKEPLAKVTTIFDRTTQQLVGAVVYASIAEEVINYLTLLMNSQVTQAQLGQRILAYPSPASDLAYYYG
ncbi:dihydrolipoyl dehydrogenase family protein [Loigolactobacillus jiayinensis]|uniref:Dihydrolipoyl dehydrogenase family protein n=1 Tax=Loigolactobacillus jiayinensis TaxID=2486016 RepID=A0ABW1RA46_9LACO|nr:NAD(P)/FAD-dependent oxidoreductase [Loigolactobacillus jiayinensis]